MNKLKKIGLAAVVMVGLVGSGTLTNSASVDAASNGIDTTVVNEKWGKPTFVYGGGLSEAQIKETEQLLNIKDLDNVASVAVTGKDLQHYLNTGSGNTANMISSVLVQKEDEGTGVKVTIETPENISEITQEQYANAAITAGVNDAKIMVASVRPVTGESALTGIYKAFDVNGEELDQDRMEVAQEELETTNEIAQENAENSDFDSAKLDKAIIEIKQALADLKEQQGQLATKEDIKQIIDEALANNQLENVVTQQQIDQLMALFEKYQKTSAIDSQQVKEQLQNLSETVKDKIGNVVQQAEDSGLTDKIGNFFKQIWDAIVGLFN
ncbi:MAG: DUF1002 domain-containing protein [Carnobacterium sp.]|uniref:DUF1002 domain-containing protein n=1 Tax=Carnobacterium antarcticum TaxID=2126436 RepID=A0ABW4NNU3_9LACT|nr:MULTISPECIES: DUF1002 domain-containing protein [unclassified Carnobacterium]ALV22649.1 putative secreted protein [Carnobacterium sp. CP1]QQP70552.1 DUF1002 domain-containing protein [Carnobacterium sp. CS13]